MYNKSKDGVYRKSKRLHMPNTFHCSVKTGLSGADYIETLSDNMIYFTALVGEIDFQSFSQVQTQ